MFHKVITKYGLATHLALLASLPFSLAPFVPERPLGITILWLSFFSFLWLLLEPSILAGEHLSLARVRVRRGIIRDPLFWFFLLVIVFAGVRWLNGDVCLRYNSEESIWFVSEPKMALLPASVGESGFLPFSVAVGIGILSLGILHGIGLSARISFGLTTGFLFGVGGWCAGVFVCLGWQPLLASATAGFLSGPFYGTCFGLGMLLSLIAGVQAEARKWAAARLLFCVGISGNLFGLLFFAPPLAIACYVVVCLIYLLLCLVHLSRTSSLGSVAYCLTMILFAVALALSLFLAVAPDQVVSLKSEGIGLATAFPEVYHESNGILNRICRSIWEESPWRGAGIGAFALKAQFLAEKTDWQVLPPNVSRALNGYWMLLAERGILGCIIFVAAVILFLFTWFRNLVRAVVYLRQRDDADFFMFACTPMVWTVPGLLALVGVEAVFTPVFSRSVTLFAIVTIFALAAASFPRDSCSRKAIVD